MEAKEVYPHEKGAEISYLVIVLHFVDGHSVDAELGYKEQGRGETAFETEMDRSFLAVSGMLFVGSTGHNRSPVSYTHLRLRPALAGWRCIN